MCDCMTEVNKELAEHNTRLQSGFMLSKGLNKMTVKPLLAVEKIDSKSRKKPMSVAPTFCPFCGTAYRPEDVEAATAATA